MPKLAKIKGPEFEAALGDMLMTMSDLAEKIGSDKSYLSRIKSNRDPCGCSVKFVRRILNGFGNKYKFDDLFFWSD